MQYHKNILCSALTSCLLLSACSGSSPQNKQSSTQENTAETYLLNLIKNKQDYQFKQHQFDLNTLVKEVDAAKVIALADGDNAYLDAASKAFTQVLRP